jgi:hypothetical protein
MLADDYFRAGVFCLNGEKNKNLVLGGSAPTLFLFSHSMELALKAWLMKSGRSAQQAKKYSHDLRRLLKDCVRTKLPLNIEKILASYACEIEELHIDEQGNVVSEFQKLSQIPPRELKREFLRHFLILNQVHGQSSYRLRYPQTGYFSLPNTQLIAAICDRVIEEIWNSVVQTKRPRS